MNCQAFCNDLRPISVIEVEKFQRRMTKVCPECEVTSQNKAANKMVQTSRSCKDTSEKLKHQIVLLKQWTAGHQ
jgi:hypothetical protein